MRSWTSSALQHCALSVLSAAALTACSDGARPTATEPGNALASYDVASVAPAQRPTFGDRRLEVLFAVAPGPGQVELVTNGSFELNGGPTSPVFAGWENFNQPGGDQNGFRVQTGTVSPPPGVFPVPPPPDGAFTAMSTQGGPGTHIISQVITLPPGGNGQLFFRLFIGNRAFAFFSPPSLSFTVFPNQQFRMDVMDPAAPIDDVGAGVLLNVYQTQPGDPLVSNGYLTVTADLSAFNGRSVRLRFAQVDNQGFFNAGVDDVSVIAQVDPTDKGQCKDGEWQDFGFKNQGQCVRFTNTGKDSRNGNGGGTDPGADGQFANGSFETGDYTGWTLFEGPQPVPVSGTWGIATNGQTINPGQLVFDFFDQIDVVQTSPGLPHTYTATDGQFVSLQLQNGPQNHRMYQDITLPAGATTISWDMEYRNHSGSFVPAFQEMAINVRDPVTDAILATLYRTTPGVDPQSIPMTHFTRDVSAFAGRRIRFSVDHSVNAFYFDAAWDNFTVDLRVPSDMDECKNDGWMTVVRADGTPFKNQGDCIQYVNTAK